MNKTNRKTKDSLFTRLFSLPEYAFQLYKVLHPEDTETTEKDLKIITIENIFVNDCYNDLGLLVKDKLILLVEAQSSWNPNMAVRTFLYLANTYKRYIDSNRIDLFSPKVVVIPKPEVVVIFTGERKNLPEFQKLSDHFKNDIGTKSSLELSVEIIYNSCSDDIVCQYINFCKVFDAQMKLYHDDKERAVIETIKICKNKKLLEKFIREHELEVNELMKDFIFDEDRMREIHEENMKKIFEEQNEEIQANKKIIEASRAEIEANKAELEASRTELETNKAELEASRTELETKSFELQKYKDYLIANGIPLPV